MGENEGYRPVSQQYDIFSAPLLCAIKTKVENILLIRTECGYFLQGSYWSLEKHFFPFCGRKKEFQFTKVRWKNLQMNRKIAKFYGIKFHQTCPAPTSTHAYHHNFIDNELNFALRVHHMIDRTFISLPVILILNFLISVVRDTHVEVEGYAYKKNKHKHKITSLKVITYRERERGLTAVQPVERIWNVG